MENLPDGTTVFKSLQEVGGLWWLKSSGPLSNHDDNESSSDGSRFHKKNIVLVNIGTENACGLNIHKHNNYMYNKM